MSTTGESNVGQGQQVQRSTAGVRALLATACILQACAATPDHSVQREADNTPHAIEGHWAIGDTRSTVEIKPCAGSDSALCAHLTAFDGHPDARDLLQPRWLSWGQRLCNSLLVNDLVYSDETRLYTGTFYDPDAGEYYRLVILMRSANEVAARVFMGAEVGEAVSLGINGLTGNVGVLSTLSLVARASLGKEHLGETIAWRRTSPSDHCEPLNSVSMQAHSTTSGSDV